MGNLPPWVWRIIFGLTIGAAIVGIIVSIIVYNDKEIVAPPNLNPPNPNEDAIIIVRDFKTQMPLDDVDLEISTKEGVIHAKTTAIGTYRFQVPRQKLGEVYITLRKLGYKTKNDYPVIFSINPERPKIIYLESESGDAQPPESINFQSLKPLTTDVLKNLVIQQGTCSQVPTLEFNRCVGLSFQNTVILGIFEKPINYGKVYSPVREQKTSLGTTVSEVIPDAIFDFTHDVTGKIYDKGGYVEVKAVNETLLLQSSSYQIIGLIDATSRLPIVKKEGTPALVFITTHDTNIDNEVKVMATLQNVALYQYKAYVDDRNRVCLTSPNWLNQFETKNSTTFLEPYQKVRCSDLLPPSQVEPHDPDPAELSLMEVFYHSYS